MKVLAMSTTEDEEMGDTFADRAETYYQKRPKWKGHRYNFTNDTKMYTSTRQVTWPGTNGLLLCVTTRPMLVSKLEGSRCKL